jgi:hypothetical protein
LIGFSDLNKMFVVQSGFYELHFTYCIRGQLLIGESDIGEVRGLATVVCSAVLNSKTSQSHLMNNPQKGT